MYASATTSAVVHMLIVTVGLLGWPVLNVTFNEFFGKAPQRDVLSYEERSDFQAKYQPGALTDSSGQEEQAVTIGGIDTNDDLDTMSDGDLGFDEPGDGPQDTTKSGQPDTPALQNQPTGHEGSGTARDEESPTTGENDEVGGRGEDMSASAPTREIIVFVTLRPEPDPDSEVGDALAANEKGPTKSPSPTAADSTGERLGEMAALLQGTPTIEREAPREGHETGEQEADTTEARAADPTRAAAPTLGDISPPDQRELDRSETEGTASPDAPTDTEQLLANGAAATARNTTAETARAAAASETAENRQIPTQVVAAGKDDVLRSPNEAVTDRPAFMSDPNDPLARLYAAVAGDDLRLASALLDPAEGEAVGGTPDPGALKTNMLLEEVADAGLATAQLALAKRYIVGLAEGRDPEKLVELLRNAAEQGSVEAQLLLGALFADGKVVAKDLIQSRVFLELAAAQGSQEARQVVPMVERQMGPEEIGEARRLAREYRRFIQAMPRPATRGDLGQGLRDQLLDAAAAGNTAKIAELLARGADLEGTDTSGRTAVINAAWRGREDVVDLLVELGADFNVTDYDGRTALSWAASNGHTEIVNKLLGAGAVNAIADNEGLTPLMRAAWNGHETIVRALIDKGARVSEADPKGNTALDYAAQGGHGEIVRILRAFGA